MRFLLWERVTRDAIGGIFRKFLNIKGRMIFYRFRIKNA